MGAHTFEFNFSLMASKCATGHSPDKNMLRVKDYFQDVICPRATRKREYSLRDGNTIEVFLSEARRFLCTLPLFTFLHALSYHDTRYAA